MSSRLLGRTQAATTTAIWCALDANSQAEDPVVAESSYGKCQQNFSAAKSFPGFQESVYRSNVSLLTGAASALEEMVKKYSHRQTRRSDGSAAEGLTAARGEFFAPDEKTEEELSIFDVVHQKYQEVKLHGRI